MKHVDIMKGPSGCGKSTWAEGAIMAFRATHELKALGAELATRVSTDLFFSEDEDPDEYKRKFNPAQLGEAHAWNLNQFLKAIRLGTRYIVVDNTSSREWEWKNYHDIAVMSSYTVRIVDMTPTIVKEMKLCACRNNHGVPDEIVAGMVIRAEPVPIGVEQLKLPPFTAFDPKWNREG